jgi:hypothetical protein
MHLLCQNADESVVLIKLEYVSFYFNSITNTDRYALNICTEHENWKLSIIFIVLEILRWETEIVIKTSLSKRSLIAAFGNNLNNSSRLSSIVTGNLESLSETRYIKKYIIKSIMKIKYIYITQCVALILIYKNNIWLVCDLHVYVYVVCRKTCSWKMVMTELAQNL